MVDLLLETNGTADQPTAEPNEDLVDSVHSSLTEGADGSSSSEGTMLSVSKISLEENTVAIREESSELENQVIQEAEGSVFLHVNRVVERDMSASSSNFQSGKLSREDIAKV
jgi:hypothetical protein